MVNEIGEKFLLYGTAKEIQDVAKETYSNSENTSKLFEVESIPHDLQQGELLVIQYFNSLTQYLQQLYLFETFKWKCTSDEASHKQIVEKKQVYKFLLRLNKDFDEVQGRVLGTKPLPSIPEVFSEVHQEESHKKVMICSQSTTPTTKEEFALVV